MVFEEQAIHQVIQSRAGREANKALKYLVIVSFLIRERIALK